MNLAIELNDLPNGLIQILINEQLESGEFVCKEVRHVYNENLREIITDLQGEFNDYEIEFYKEGDTLDMGTLEE
jgi:hypothetical protein